MFSAGSDICAAALASLLLLWSLAGHLLLHGILVGVVVLDTNILKMEHLPPVSGAAHWWLCGQQEGIQGVFFG